MIKKEIREINVLLSLKKSFLEGENKFMYNHKHLSLKLIFKNNINVD